MEPERSERVRGVLADALELPPAQRADLLESLYAGDPALRRDLDAVLDGQSAADLLSTCPAAPTLAVALRADAVSVHDPNLYTPGTHIGPYEIRRPLGAGGMGQVYLAHDSRLHRDVALKCVSRRIAGGAISRPRTLGEARAAARLDHHAIARVYDVVEHEDGSLVIVMEYLSGESLAARLRRETCDVREAVDIAIEVADALAHAHQAGIVHCDIKPGNIQLTDGHAVKVLDFGVARSLFNPSDSTTSTLNPPGRIGGTPGYMAPEQALGIGVDARSDIFSLGVVLFEMIAGTRPFAGEIGWVEPLRAVLSEAPTLDRLGPMVPDDLKAVLTRMLAREPEARFPDATALRDALHRVRDGLNRGRTGVAARFLARPAFRIAAIATVAIAALGSGLAWYSSRAPVSFAVSPQAQRWYVDGVAALQEGAYLQAARALEQAAAIDANHPLTWARLGEAQLELDQQAAARQSLLKAAALVPDRSRLADHDRLSLEGAMAMAARDAEGALRAYTELARIRPSAPVLLDLGRAHEAANATAEAIESYRRAAELDPQNPAPLLRLGVLLARRQNVKEADAAFARAEQLYTARGRVEGVAMVFYERGVMLDRIDRAADAQAALERARQLAESVDSRYLRAAIAFKLSSVAGAQGRLADAERLAKEARQLSANFPGLNAFGLVDVGNVYLYAGKHQPAEGIFREALANAERAGAPRAEARARLALAALLLNQQNVDEASAHARAALAYYEQTGFIAQQTFARTLLIRLQELQGDLAGAQQNYETLLAAAIKRSSEDEIAEAHYSLCGVLLARERYATALAHCNEAVKRFGTLKLTYDLNYALLRHAGVSWRLGRFDDAERDLSALVASRTATEKVVAIPEQARTLERARLALARGDAALAAKLARAVITSGEEVDEPLRAELFLVAALALARAAQPGPALTHIETAAAAARESGDPVQVAAVELARAEVLLSGRRYEEALKIATGLASQFNQQQRHESAWIASRIAGDAAVSLRLDSEAARWDERSQAEQKELMAQLDGDAVGTYGRRADIRRLQRKGGGA